MGTPSREPTQQGDWRDTVSAAMERLAPEGLRGQGRSDAEERELARTFLAGEVTGLTWAEMPSAGAMLGGQWRNARSNGGPGGAAG